jgi:UTRA domain
LRNYLASGTEALNILTRMPREWSTSSGSVFRQVGKEGIMVLPLLGKDEGYIPLFKWLREHKVLRAARAFERLNCHMPTAEEASLLNISRSQPVIDLERRVWADNGMLFEYSLVIANAALHEFDRKGL